MALRPSTRTFGAVKRQVRRIFGDEASVQLSDEDIQQWVDDAQQAVVTKNKALKAVSTSLSVPGQASYDFPTPLIQQVESILFDGVLLNHVELASAQSLIQSNDPHFEDSGVPVSWYEWGGNFTLYPKPDSEKEIALYYSRYPAPMSGDEGQLLDLPDKYFQAVVDFCLWKAYELDEAWDAAQMKEGHFRGALEEQGEEEREAAHLLYPTIQEAW